MSFNSFSYSLLLSSSAGDSLLRLVSIPEYGKGGGLDRRISVESFEIKAEEHLWAVLFEYSYSSGAVRYNNNLHYLGTCVLREGRLVERCRSSEVAQTNVSGSVDSSKWLWVAVDASGDEPARFSAVCPLVRDVNLDGYRDLVLWRKHWRSAQAAEIDEENVYARQYELESEELLMQVFDPGGSRFRDLEPAVGQKPPVASECYRDLR